MRTIHSQLLTRENVELKLGNVGRGGFISIIFQYTRIFFRVKAEYAIAISVNGCCLNVEYRIQLKHLNAIVFENLV